MSEESAVRFQYGFSPCDNVSHLLKWVAVCQQALRRYSTGVMPVTCSFLIVILAAAVFDCAAFKFFIIHAVEAEFLSVVPDAFQFRQVGHRHQRVEGLGAEKPVVFLRHQKETGLHEQS